MKETVGSLRAYFVIVGLLTVAACPVAWHRADSSGVILSFYAVIGLGYVYVGIAMPKLLRTSILPVQVLVGCAIIISLAQLLRAPPQGIVGLLISWYLLHQTRRLQLEAAEPPSPPS